jgi:hypothetical protein
MDKYFRTLSSTRQLYAMNCRANGQRYIDQEGLVKAMKSALRRHHDVGAEASYIINTYNSEERGDGISETATVQG